MNAVARLPQPSRPEVTLARAVEVFLAQPDLLPKTVRTYRAVLETLVDEVGAPRLRTRVPARTRTRRWRCSASSTPVSLLTQRVDRSRQNLTTVAAEPVTHYTMSPVVR
jgi:hypothetical protein